MPGLRLTPAQAARLLGLDHHSCQRIINTLVRTAFLRWTADGSGLTYINNQGGVSNIWMQPLAGGPPKQLTDFKSDMIFHFDWSRDGKQLALSRGIFTSDVILLNNVK